MVENKVFGNHRRLFNRRGTSAAVSQNGSAGTIIYLKYLGSVVGIVIQAAGRMEFMDDSCTQDFLIVQRAVTTVEMFERARYEVQIQFYYVVNTVVFTTDHTHILAPHGRL